MDADIFLVSANVLGSMIVLGITFTALHSMSRKTNHWVRWAMIVLATAAFAEICSGAYGFEPSIQQVTMTLGVAMLIHGNRRKSVPEPA